MMLRIVEGEGTSNSFQGFGSVHDLLSDSAQITFDTYNKVWICYNLESGISLICGHLAQSPIKTNLILFPSVGATAD